MSNRQITRRPATLTEQVQASAAQRGRPAAAATVVPAVGLSAGLGLLAGLGPIGMLLLVGATAFVATATGDAIDGR